MNETLKTNLVEILKWIGYVDNCNVMKDEKQARFCVMGRRNLEDNKKRKSRLMWHELTNERQRFGIPFCHIKRPISFDSFL